MLFDHRQILVKERLAIVKLTDVYDLVDPASGRTLGLAREEPETWAKWLRLLVKKSFLPTHVRIYESESAPAVLALHKSAGFLKHRVTVVKATGEVVGSFTSKIFSLGGGFFAHDATGQQVAEIQGDWKGWNFRFLDRTGRELGKVTKKWAGIGKELFTTADTYIIALEEHAARNADSVALLLAAGLAIDMVFKEQ